MPRIHPEVKLSGDRNECPTCGELFNSTSAFDRHRTGPFGEKGQPAARRCRSVAEMQQLGMVKNSAGFWIRSPMSQAVKNARIAGTGSVPA
jgi:hypothetical protein